VDYYCNPWCNVLGEQWFPLHPLIFVTSLNLITWFFSKFFFNNMRKKYTIKKQSSVKKKPHQIHKLGHHELPRQNHKPHRKTK